MVKINKSRLFHEDKQLKVFENHWLALGSFRQVQLCKIKTYVLLFKSICTGNEKKTGKIQKSSCRT